MPRPSADQRLLPSILDRMLDDQPKVTRDPEDAPARHLVQMKEAVKRDLEWLLNSKQVVARLPADLRQIHRSLLTYGMPDFTSSNLSSNSDQIVLLRAVEQVISRFEPRLTRVVVALAAGREAERALHFRIDALLKVDPEPEPVTFDSVLQLSNKAFVVKGE